MRHHRRLLAGAGVVALAVAATMTGPAATKGPRHDTANRRAVPPAWVDFDHRATTATQRAPVAGASTVAAVAAPPTLGVPPPNIGAAVARAPGAPPRRVEVLWQITWTRQQPAVAAARSITAPPPPPPSTPGPPQAPPAPTRATVTWPGWQIEMLNDVNGQRAAVGLPALSLCYPLASAAENHSADQAAMNNMTHLGSSGSYLNDRADGGGYLNWSMLAENIAEGYTSVASVMSAWVASPDHLENMLHPEFTDVGFGEGTSSAGIWYWTQDFGAGGAC